MSACLSPVQLLNLNFLDYWQVSDLGIVRTVPSDGDR